MFFFSKGELEGHEVHEDVNEDDEEEEYENTAIGGGERDLAGTAI